MAIALVQSAERNIGPSTLTLPATPTPGNFLVIWQAFRDYTSGNWPIPPGFTQITTHVTSTSDTFRDRVGAMGYREVQPGDPAAWDTYGWSSGMVSLSEWSGIDSLYTAAAQSNASSATWNCGGSLTAPGAVDVLVIGGSMGGSKPGSSGDGSHSLDPVAGTTELMDMRNNNNATPRSWVGYKIVAAAAGAQTVSGTLDDLDPRQFGGITAMFVSAAAGSPPEADFSGTPLSGVGTLEVDFTDESTGSPTSWAWDFGDGDTSTSQNPTHTYTDPGTYDVSLTATNADGDSTLVKGAYVFVGEVATPGGGFEWDGLTFTVERIKEVTIQRGASAELTGGSQPGSMTIILINALVTGPQDDRYNPENVSGPLYGMLHDGIRVWFGVNEDGTVTFDAGKVVKGLFAGYITDLSVQPEGGAEVAPFVEVVCADPLEWYGRQRVTLPDSTTRSQYDLRLEVLDALEVPFLDLAPEPATLPLSSADGLGLNILDSINAANGTRHYAKPADSAELWYTYTTVRRTALLDGTSDAALDAGSDHVTGTTGFRVSADGIINQQKASVEAITYPPRREVWLYDALPLTITDETVIWAEFDDYVRDAVVDYAFTGTTPTVSIEHFGDTAKVTVDSPGTTVFTALSIEGRLVQRGSVVSVVIDDLVSQAEPRGVRAGPDLTGDYLGTLTSARGFAAHIVWRFGDHKYRPTITVENWMPEMFDLDLFSRIELTVTQLSITRIFEIVGLTLHSDLAALSGSTPVVLHTATYVLQESKVQEPFGWFIIGSSDIGSSDVLAY